MSFAFEPLRVVLELYSGFSPDLVQFQKLSKRSDWSIYQKQRGTLFVARPPFLSSDGAVGRARDRSRDANEVIRIMSYLILENVSKDIFKYLLYSPRKKWPELELFYLQCSCLSTVFVTLPKCFKNALKIVIPRPPQPRFTMVE